VKEFRVVSGLGSTRRTKRHAAIHVLLLAPLLLLAALLSHPAAAQSAKGEVTASTDNGFVRLVFTLPEDAEPQVKATNGIVVITFQRRVEITVDKLAAGAPGVISAARRDPDGRGVRIALARKVTVNSVSAAERLFVDILPDTWTGLPPGLPREVIEDLSRRTREADRKAKQQNVVARRSKMTPIRLRVASQPMFTRYVFELPEPIGVAANTGKDKLTLTFDAPLKLDLADAKVALPAVIGAIDSEFDQDAVVVRFTFAGKVDVRTFREDLNFVVDITPMDARTERPEAAGKPDELSAMAAELAARASVPPPTGIEAPQMPQAQLPVAPMASPAAEPAPPATAPAQDARAQEARAQEAAAKEAPPSATPPALAAAAEPATPPDDGKGSYDTLINVAFKRQGDNLSLFFPFASATPAAVFSRADTLWLVFDTSAAIALGKLEGEPSRIIKSASVTRRDDVAVVHIKLERPRLVSAMAEGPAWTVTLGGEVTEPTRPVAISRNIIGAARSSVVVPFDDPRRLHRLKDPEAGDELLVVTALGPTRGFVKTQEFVEFRALTSTHGVIVQPFADDLNAQLAFDKIVITRPAGLSLSALTGGGANAGGGAVYQPHVVNPQVWEYDRQADFKERRSQLIRAAAEAPEQKRLIARADLARFFLARDMGVEAKAVLDVALADNAPTAEDPTPLVLRAIANIMMGRLEAALKDLGHPLVANQYDAPLWRALVYARQGKWNDAREGFRAVGMSLAIYPLEMQRMVLKDMVRASIEIGDITEAASRLHELEAIGIPREFEAKFAVLSGRVAEGLGRKFDALRAYQAAADSWDRPAAAQGRLRELLLQRSLGKLDQPDAIGALETLTTVWRGDETEVEALQLLAHLYTAEGRFRDAFHVMRTALAAHPDSDMTRRIHDEAAETFDSLFLAGKGDGLPPIDALGLFYDFRELTPIGRRGDEMIRRLADRLVSVDLLAQAAELLQHQVDHRLTGAGRAQVATRLAVIYLMNRKPDRTLATLRATRMTDLSNDLRNQRLLIEARALSDLGRHDLALEVVANIPGRETMRLRSDILWAGRRWRDSAEQIELLYGDRWREFAPLAVGERKDILRAGVGYVLGDDSIGLGRLREKYSGKMEDGPDRRAFDVVTAPVDTSGKEFREVAHSIAAVDTLDAFLRDLRTRYPEAAAASTAQRTEQERAARAAALRGQMSDPPITGTATPRPSAKGGATKDAAASPLPPAPGAAVRPSSPRGAAR
jgi:tetratricopeptide (TPR) repeat protein